MATLAFELVLRFLWGSLFLIAFVSRSETSERFLKIAYWISLGCATFMTLLIESSDIPQSPLYYYAYASLGLLLIGSFFYCFSWASLWRLLGLVLVVVSPLAYLFYKDFNVFEHINFFTSSLLLGSIFLGQYLGHWYLTVAGMHIEEFKRIVKFMFLAIFLKTFEIIYTLFSHQSQALWSQIDEMGRPLGLNVHQSANMEALNLNTSFFSLTGDVWMGLGNFGVLLFISRVLWGILAPLILVFMVKKTVDTRSTQSATGILYSMCVMLIIGEAIALYMKNSIGWFL